MKRYVPRTTATKRALLKSSFNMEAAKKVVEMDKNLRKLEEICSTYCRGGVLCDREGRGRGARGASVGGRDGVEDVCESSHLVCRQGGGVSTCFGKTATHRVEVFVGPGGSVRPEDRDQEDQWTR